MGLRGGLQLRGRAVGQARREVDADEVDAVPSTSSSTCSAAAFGVGSARPVPDRQRPTHVGRERLRIARPTVPARAVARRRAARDRDVPVRTGARRLGAELGRRRVDRRGPSSGHHDSCTTITSASKPRSTLDEVVGRATPLRRG